MKVKMNTHLSGTRNGADWPAVDEVADLPDAEAADMIAAGLARIIDEPKVERATSRRKTETATRKG